MRDQWLASFTDTARSYWTESRTFALCQGKTLPLTPADAAPLLRALGLLQRDASMSPQSARKFFQINHLVVLLEPIIQDLIATRGKLYLVDAACGGSYLTFVLAYCFLHRWKHPVEIVGFDRNSALLDKCRARSEHVGLESVLRFAPSDLHNVNVEALWQQTFAHPPARLDALFALHACDTASDHALALGVTLGADLIAVAPCCHAELAARWSELSTAQISGPLEPVWQSPHLRREMAASTTDTMRMLLLRAAGYRTTAMEFVPSEHTPKNTLIRARKTADSDDSLRTGADLQLCALVEATGGCTITLEALLRTER